MSEQVKARVQAPGPKRILALDGGGVRGLVELGALERVENILAERYGDPDYRLSGYFDLIGGASTGAIIATLLALGWRVGDIRRMYLEMCPKVFGRRTLLGRIGLRSKFDTAQFAEQLDKAFREVSQKLGVDPKDLTLKTDALRTGLAIFTKRIDTGSVWVQSNIPGRRFWAEDGGNRDYNLRKLVQASAAAPYFLDPVAMNVDPEQPGVFIDGGASPHNNPSRELFLMAALRSDQGAPSPHGLGWRTGADQIMMMSIGAGSFRRRINPRRYSTDFAISSAIHALTTIIEDASMDAVAWMQAISAPAKPVMINGNIGDMRGFRIVEQPLLTFQRVNAELESDWLRDNLQIELSSFRLKRVRQFDCAARRNLDNLTCIGEALGATQIGPEDFPPAFDPTP